MRDLSDIYDYAHKAESGDVEVEEIYDSAKRALNKRVREEMRSYKKRAADNRQKYYPSKNHMGFVAVPALVIAVGIVVFFAVHSAASREDEDFLSGVSESSQSSTEDNSDSNSELSTSYSASSSSEISNSSKTSEAIVSSVETSTHTEMSQPEESSNEFIAESFHGYKVGDIVTYSGTVHYSSSDTNNLKGACRGGAALISGINPNGLHPFHLVHIDDNSDVYGWVDEAFISKQ